MTLFDDAARAGARALCEAGIYVKVSHQDEDGDLVFSMAQRTEQELAEIALTAMLPVIREGIAREIEAYRDRPWTFDEVMEKSIHDVLSAAGKVVRSDD